MYEGIGYEKMCEGHGNLFDHGKSSQAAVIKPFMARIRERAAGTGIDSDFREYFMKQLESCLAMIGEHENRPKWVKDITAYRMRSEIVAFISLFSCLDLGEDPTHVEKEQTTELYEEVQEFGKERGWDLHILHLQFIRIMGARMQNYIIQIVLPRKLKPEDYN